MSERYRKSEAMLERALKTIPLGSQTFSKSKTQYPFGVSPFFIQKGKGSHVWDVDGNEYIDFINGLASITLGYCDPEVTRAVHAQLDEGTIFSLPHPLEVEVAELIQKMVPCAEMVRFGKNGSDATAGAIRLARAYTNRDHVAVCGYHGWLDWYIGSTTRNLGVPQSTRHLTHKFAYNDIDSINTLFTQWPDQIAAVIMEPMSYENPKPGYLEEVKEITHRHGAVFVFDETITGFRYAKGGAQELLNVVPDLATFGKGIANGFPISAVAGQGKIMKWMEEIFYSFTFGGETLSLAAAFATMTKLRKYPVLETLKSQGAKILNALNKIIQESGVGDFVSLAGHPSWSFIMFKDVSPYSAFDLKTLFLQECFARGILTLGTHNMSYSHSDADIKRLLAAYNEIFPIVADSVKNKKLKDYLHCKPLEPLFKVR